MPHVWPRPVVVAVGAVLAAALALSACSGPERSPVRKHRLGDRSSRPVMPSGSASPTSAASGAADLILASGFDLPVCGSFALSQGSHRGGCEFGIEGDVRTGSFACRTGDSCVEIQRLSPDQHMGIITVTPLPEGSAYVGAAHRVPSIPRGALPSGGFLQLEQLSPTDGSTLPAWPVEVRMYPDRTLGLALFIGREAARTRWRAPIDRWFYVVVQVSNGVDATQRMWVYDDANRLVDQVAIRLDTRQQWVHGFRAADKIGGTASTLVPMFTYADDWYISTMNEGPLHIGPDGQPLSA